MAPPRRAPRYEADLNPLAADSGYHFDYGTSSSYGSSVPVPNGGLGSGTDDAPVSQHLSGLAPSRSTATA